MSYTDQVRTSRDGDQFHYLWAARRCLRLLDRSTDLTAVTIEGFSNREDDARSSRSGEEVVDIAEYYGSESPREARAIAYLQLKHSTVRTDREWQPSELETTLKGFGANHAHLVQEFGEESVLDRVSYGFITNRPVSEQIRRTILELARGGTPTYPRVAARLSADTKLAPDLLPGFFACLTISDGEARFTAQSGLLSIEASRFLAGEDLNAALRLNAFVTDKATTKGKADPAVRLGDVLTALGVGPDQLLPAESKLEPSQEAIPRLQEPEIVDAIKSTRDPLLILAPGGTGKSVLATRLPGLMPNGSVSVVFDCFANGEYRRRAQLRHTHRRALVQIANELAGQGLCLPLVPTTGADAQDYMRAFLDRLEVASHLVRSQSPDALLLIAVDAADNAVMAQEEMGTDGAFVQDLLSEPMPEGVRLVMLCRPERRHLLRPPPNTRDLLLKGFEFSETSAHLRGKYEDASDNDTHEFHRLSSANPRVQANALATQLDLKSTLRSLGPNPTSVDDTISQQLSSSIAQLRFDAAGQGGDIDILCVALAALRPLIPLDVLARASGVSVDALHSFASDFGRGRWLLIAGEALQFRDEPVEDWFRKSFVADRDQLRTFVARLSPLADESPYVAATLPALMLECGQFDELVNLALSSERLPTDAPLERREIELERLRFALKASLQRKRWLDAAKLATRAGEEAAGQARHESLLEANTDLVGTLLDVEQILEIAARRTFGGGWLGARYASEAALLSTKAELRGDALNRLGIAYQLLDGWARLAPKERQEQSVSDEDRAELALADLNLRGAESAVRELARWRPHGLWFNTMVIVAAKLVDHARFDDLDALALAAADAKAGVMISAIAVALSAVQRVPPKEAVEAALALPGAGNPLGHRAEDWTYDAGLHAVTALVEAAMFHGVGDRRRLARMLNQRLPKKPPTSLGRDFNRGRPGLLRAFALRAGLRGNRLQLADVADDQTKAALSAKGGGSGRDVDEFKARVGASLPFCCLRIRQLMEGNSFDIESELAAAQKEASLAYGHYYREYSVANEIALVWFDVICRSPDPTSLLPQFENWVASQKRALQQGTWTAITRKAARNSALRSHAHTFAQRAVAEDWSAYADDAATKIDDIVLISRAILAVDRREADALFDQAVEAASLLGDEAGLRWESLLALARHGAAPTNPAPELVYRLSRAAEVAAEYINDHFNWSGTVEAFTGLCPASSVAIVSRWRDREIASGRDHFATLIETLIERDLIDPRLAVPLLRYRHPWDAAAVLKRALKAEPEVSRRQAMFDFAVRGEALDEAAIELWRTFGELATEFQLDLTGVDRAARSAALRPTERYYSPEPPPRPRTRRKSIAAKLQRMKLESFEDALRARKALKETGYSREFWRAVFGRIPASELAAFVTAALGDGGLHVYDLRSFFEELPSQSRKQLAVARAIQSGVLGLVRRNSESFAWPRRWSALPIETAVKWSSLPRSELVAAAVATQGESVEKLGSSELFNLAGLLGEFLTIDEGREALAYALSLIEVSVQEDTGDGPWRSELTVGEPIETAIAGAIWATLGAVERGLKWEAAHVVRALAAFGFQQIVASLLNRAIEGKSGPYSSPKLFFYSFDAQLYLMIGLARAALESPNEVAAHTAALVPFAKRSNPHVLVRHHAAKAVLALEAAGAVALDEALKKELMGLDRTRRRVRVSDSYGFARRRKRTKETEDRFYFDYDLSKGMMDSLARAFGMAKEDLEDVAADIIRKDWGLTEKGEWARDPRQNHRSFQYGRDDVQVDRLNGYLTIHSTMCAAGKLLETRDVLRNRNEAVDEFTDWLGWRLLTRRDGLWVSDRRDPAPELKPLPDVPRDLWRWSVQRADFSEAIGLVDSHLTIWGRWQQRRGDLQHSVEVRSALVAPATAGSLLAASQSAMHPYDMSLPRFEDGEDYLPRGRFSRGPYNVVPWVSDTHRDPGRDRYDPWAAEMSYPPPALAGQVAEALGLAAQEDGRRWSSDPSSVAVFDCVAWAGPIERGRRAYPTHGEFLRVRRKSLRPMLRRLRLDLMVEVHIRRSFSETSYSSRQQDEFVEYPQANVMFFLFRQDGSVETAT